MTEVAKSVTPVFVLGLQRSGTTWLANLISNHADICSVGSVDHHGIHESIFFSHFAREYGDLTVTENYQRFIREFVKSDYFVLSGVEASWFEAQHVTSYAEVFRLLMEAVAAKKGAKAWVEKSPHHTLLAYQLAEMYPDAKFVCVIRDYQSMIRSRLWAFGRTPPGYPFRVYKIARACSVNSLYERFLERFCQNNPHAMLVRYEDLKSETHNNINRVFRFLNQGEVDKGFKAAYAANSSFASVSQKEQGLGVIDKFFIFIFKSLMNLAPYGLLAYLEKRERSKGVEWPEWCWVINKRPPG